MWKKWSKNGKQYLRSLNDRIKLYDVINEYSNKVISFYNWFDEQLEIIHSQEFKETEELKKRFEIMLAEYKKTLGKSV